MRQSRMALTRCAILTGVVVGLLALPATGQVDDDSTDTAINRGVAYLLGQVTSTIDQQRNFGELALECYALVAAGVSPDQTSVRSAIEQLKKRSKRESNTYAISCYVFLLDAIIAQHELDHRLLAPQRVRDRDDALLALATDERKRLVEAVERLASWQHASGGFRYGPKPKDYDLSCTQFAVLALGVGHKRGVTIARATWQKLLEELIDVQAKNGKVTDKRITLVPEADRDDADGSITITGGGAKDGAGKTRKAGGRDGSGKTTKGRTAVKERDNARNPVAGLEEITVRSRGWGYIPSRDKPKWNMNCAGLSSMILADNAIGSSLDARWRQRANAAIRDSYGALLEDWRPTDSYYGMYSLEKVGDLGHVAEFDGEDWYAILAHHLIGEQRHDGSWRGKGHARNPRIATCFALLILTRASSLISSDASRRVIATGRGRAQMETNEANSKWVYVPSLGTSLHYPQLLRMLALRPNPKLARLLRTVVDLVLVDNRPQMLPDLLSAIEFGSNSSVDKLLGDIAASICSLNAFDAKTVGEFYSDFNSLRQLATLDAWRIASPLTDIFARQKNNVALARSCFSLIASKQLYACVPLLIEALSNDDVPIRSAAAHALAGLEPSAPRFEPEAAAKSRIVQLEKIREWREREGQRPSAEWLGKIELPPIVPAPLEVERRESAYVLPDPLTIVVTDQGASDIGERLAADIRLLAGIDARSRVGDPGNGHVVLSIVDASKPESSILDIADRVEITANDRHGLVWACATLRQIIVSQGLVHCVPAARISDAPGVAERAVLLDIASHPHSPRMVEDVIELASYYKVNTLYLELSGNRRLGYKPFARQAAKSERLIWTQADLAAIAEFAEGFGIEIVPALTLPDHARALTRDAKGFGKRDSDRIDLDDKRVRKRVTSLISELLDAARGRRRIIVGGRPPDGTASRRQGSLKVLAEIVTQLGGKTLAWQSDGDGDDNVPTGVALLVDRGDGRQLGMLADRGVDILNASTMPLRIEARLRPSSSAVFAWNPWSFGKSRDVREPKRPTRDWQVIDRSPHLLGAVLQSRFQPSISTMASLRGLLPVFAQRCWNSDDDIEFDELSIRIPPSLERFDALHPAVRVVAKDLLHLADVRSADSWFDGDMALELTSPRSDLEIHYTLNGAPPTRKSPRYESPMTLTKEATLRARLFDSSGTGIGGERGDVYYESGLAPENLLTGKRVMVGTEEKGHPAAHSNDRRRDSASSWWSKKESDVLTVDLELEYCIDRIRVTTQWGGERCCQYAFDVSENGRQWQTIVDESKNAKVARSSGREHRFPYVKARFVRLRLLGVTGVDRPQDKRPRLVEFEVYEAR